MDAGLEGLDTIIVAAPEPRLSRLVGGARNAGVRTVAVATCLDQAVAAEAAGADAVIAKGHEAGGWVGEQGAFVLLQRLVEALRVPVLVQGGIGLHTIAAAWAGGAAGVLLDAQLLLSRESRLGHEVRSAIAAMDGSETVTVGSELGEPLRIYSRPDLETARELHERASRLGSTVEDRRDWRRIVSSAVGDGSLENGLLLVGQDAAFAADLAARFQTVAGILAGLRDALQRARGMLDFANPLSRGAPLAQSHGTRFPILQGPMTRVSDTPAFADAVARAGPSRSWPWPCSARGGDRDLLARRDRLGADRGASASWDLCRRAPQGAARGHPHLSPAVRLDRRGSAGPGEGTGKQGIPTYLHVPSPGLLRRSCATGRAASCSRGANAAGTSGRVRASCSGTVDASGAPRFGGPGEELDRLRRRDPRCPVGRDGRRPGRAAAERGVAVGRSWAPPICSPARRSMGRPSPRFQQEACVLRHRASGNGPGHAIRCVPSPYRDDFERERTMKAEGLAPRRSRALELSSNRPAPHRLQGVDRAGQTAPGGSSCPRSIRTSSTHGACT